eukprot:1169542_1
MDRNELLFTVFDACRCGYLEFVRHVFEDYPSDINITNSLGQTCLMLCCEFNEIGIIKYLLSKRNIHYLSSDLDEHWNSLHYALRYSNFRVAQLLLTQCTATPFPKYASGNNGYTPFDLLPPNLHRKQVYDDIYTIRNKQKQNHHMRKIYKSSFASILAKGHCQRTYGEMVCNLQVQGVLYAWGSNKHAQLGLDNHGKYRSTPKILKHLRNINVIDIACSGYHSLAVTAEGRVYAWGNNSDGRCGVGHVNKEYKPLIQRPTLLSIKSALIVSCTATLDHSCLLSNSGDVYVFGCDRNSSFIKYSNKSMKLPWNNKLRAFCVTNNCKYPMRMVSSAFERSVMIGGDHKLYFIGKTLNGNRKITTPSVISTSNSEIKKIGVERACVGDNFVVVLLLNGSLLSMNRHKQNTDSDHMEFSRIRLKKTFKFKHHHNKREQIKIKYVTCYSNNGRCVAVTSNDDIYEWKAPSTDALYIGHCHGGICSISCAPKMCVLCNTLGECYAFGDVQILGLSSKDKKLLNIKQKDKLIRIVTLSQIGRVYAAKDSVFVIQSFLWPNRNLLNATHHHKEMNKLKHKKMEQSFWNHDTTRRVHKDMDMNHMDAMNNSNNNRDLYDCFNMFEALSLDVEDIKEDDEKEEKKTVQHHKSKRSRKKKHKKGNKRLKKSKTEMQVGLDDEENNMSRVPSLVSYCEDILIHQIDLQTVISLYKQSYCMGFHRISVFLSFVIIENIQHLMYFLLRDCSEQEVLFVEHLFKTKYYPDISMNYSKYYGDVNYLSNKKRIIEQYRLVPKCYPNYKQKLSNINTTLHKIDTIEQKVKKLTQRFEREKDDTESSEEVLYFDSDAEQEDAQEQDTTDKLFTQFKPLPCNRAVERLNGKERALYESKLQILSEHNHILFKLSNPETFPSVQMMDKWKRRHKKKTHDSYHKMVDDKQHKIKTDKTFVGIGIAQSYDADKYLQHVYLKQTHVRKEKEHRSDTGFAFYLDYDEFNKPKHKKHSKAVIYRSFNVKDAMDKDAKKARKMDKKQEKKKKNAAQKHTSNQTGAAKKRRNRKRHSASNIPSSPANRAQTNKTKQKQNQIQPKSKAKTQGKSKANLNKQPQIRTPKQQPQPYRNPVSPIATHTQPTPSVVLSPIDVVRRNREKKRLEQEVAQLTNDVWDLSAKEETHASPHNEAHGSLSNILTAQKNQYEQQQRKQRHQKYVQYQETQNAWSSQQQPKDTANKKKSIRPGPNKAKEDKDTKQSKKSAIEIAQIEEMQLRSLAQHEFEWMINAPEAINNKKDDYDLFLRQQQELLRSFQNNRNETNVNTQSGGNDVNNQRTRRSEYGSRGRGGHNRRYNNNYNHYGNSYRGNRGRGGYRGRYNHHEYNNNYNHYDGGRGIRGRGRGRYNNSGNYEHNDNQRRGRGSDTYRGRGRGRYNYNDHSNEWRKK